VATLTGLVANGDQQSASSNRYIEFNFDAGFYGQVILSTTSYGFEVDNIAFGDPPSPIPEPSTLLVFGGSLSGLALVQRRRLFARGWRRSAIHPERTLNPGACGRPSS